MNGYELYLIDKLKEIIFIMSTDLTVTFVNSATCKLIGKPSEELIDLPAWELPMWDYNIEIQNELMFTLGHVFSSEEPRRIEIKARNATNEMMELDMFIQPLLSDDVVTGLMATCYNITDLVQTKGFLTKKERQIDAFFENSTQGYFFQTLPEAAIMPDIIGQKFVNQVYEAQRLESINRQVFEYLGIDAGEQLNNLDLMNRLGLTDDDRISIWIEMMSSGVASRQSELTNLTTGDKVILDLKFVAMIYDNNKFEGNFCIVSNITQQYIYERELSFLANKDPLTGLNNRRSFYRLAEQAILYQQDIYSIAMMDIDNFKSINDNHGHDVGDIAIRSAADKIDGLVGETGITGRYGGEEFIVMLPMTAVEARDIIEDIRKDLENTHVSYGSGSLTMTISSGLHEFSYNTQDDFNQAITYADKALLEAKKTGKNKSIIYKDELHGLKAIDKLTGVYNKNALLYKHRQFHDDLRRFDTTYGFVTVKLKAKMIRQSEILNQFVKQTAAMLNSTLREHDVIGRLDDLCFIILIKGVNRHVVKNIQSRIDNSLDKLSTKFDHLVSGETSQTAVEDWSIHFESLYEGFIDLTEDQIES